MALTVIWIAGLCLALIVAATADAQARQRAPERAPAAPAFDRRDSLVVAPGSPFNGRPYWQAFGQCGGIYFKLSALYTDIALGARAVKPDAKLNTEFTKKLNDARAVASAHYMAAESFLIRDRAMDRSDAVMTYDARAREAGSRLSTIDAAVAAAKPCPAVYQACHADFPKICRDPPRPGG